ncbi:HK97 gp10 family phage protein [Paenibacillus alkaliterrae]|uniref:HK97 gp10 family phage protein n=1 Tax=Paenibacillus alkaliterrae TaxID=320909 RepID=UPI001F1C18D0|nr:HK97 gp10 family phage protein [Paenibacillus alkaliterrae]MCF2939043.1 HK97 gp10 family phage protein [Paenibacillus alkaliterrae]
MRYVSHTAEFRRKYREAQERTLEAIGQTSTSWIIAAAPVGEDGGGHYKSSIQYEVNLEEQKVTAYTDAHYGPYLEFGTGIYAENGQGRKDPWSYKDESGKWHTTQGMRPRRIFRVVEERVNDLVRLAQEMMRID